MKTLGLTLFLSLCFISLNAQPVKQWGTSGIFLEETSTEATYLEETFLPGDFSTFVPESSNSFVNATQTSPGLAMLASGILPGSGQAMNGKWGRAAVYFVAEAVSIAYYVNQSAVARRNEDSYEDFGDENWSPLAYAQWLVDYSVANDLNNGYEALAQQLDDLPASAQTPAYGNTSDDWQKIDLNTLRQVERRTKFIYVGGSEGNTFSHEVQDWGSQQYYELMSKYYQFAPGWQDFHEERQAEGSAHVYQYTWDTSMISANFIEGRDRAAEFNQNYRNAGNILMFMMVNHVVSAFDAYFTVKLKNSRIQAQANMMSYTNSISVSWHF